MTADEFSVMKVYAFLRFTIEAWGLERVGEKSGCGRLILGRVVSGICRLEWGWDCVEHHWPLSRPFSTQCYMHQDTLIGPSARLCGTGRDQL